MKKIRFLLIFAVICNTALPSAFAAQIGNFGEFRFNGAKRQTYSFTQKQFSVIDNLWRADVKKQVKKISEKPDQVELFVGRIGETVNENNRNKKSEIDSDDNTKNTVVDLENLYKRYKVSGIVGIAIGGGFLGLGLILTIIGAILLPSPIGIVILSMGISTLVAGAILTPVSGGFLYKARKIKRRMK